MVSSFLALLYFLLDKSLLDWECNTDVAGRPCHLLQEMYIEVMMKMIEMIIMIIMIIMSIQKSE